jgi:hypothetical protein
VAPDSGRIRVDAAVEYVGPSIGFFDLETTYSSQPRLLTGAVADGFGNVTLLHLRNNDRWQRAIECICGVWHQVTEVGCAGSEWIDDSLLASELTKLFATFNILVGWNSKLFDEPVLNGRNMVHRLPTLDPQTHLDLMYQFSGNKARLGRRSLENISTVFESPHRKTPLNVKLWDRADHGDTTAYSLIEQHNIADVLVTRDVYWHARPRIRKYIRGG